jgi:pimeloyl-ACP methyl ester carboxylesterase
MHRREALEVLPEVLRQLEIDRPVLFGHSDGASIALIYAGEEAQSVAGVAVMAPHVFVEDMCIASIEAARQAYLMTDLRHRLERHHIDPGRAFWLWNDVWLDPAFRAWNIEQYLAAISCPVLAIQGYQDEYGTVEQLDRLARAIPRAELLKLEQCRHSPHRDQPDAVIQSLKGWMLHNSAHAVCESASPVDQKPGPIGAEN